MRKSVKTLTMLCVLSGISFIAQSQDRRQNLELGAKAGINISNVWDTEGQEFEADAKTGFAGGIFLGIPLGTLIGLQPEVLISQKGFKGSGMLLSFPYTFKRTTTYLDVPLQLQVKPAEFLTIVGGPQFSYLLNQKDEYTFGTNSTEQEEAFENDNIRRNIFGFVAGVDLIYQSLVFSGRVGWDFQSNNGDGTSETPRYKNQWLQFTLGLKI
jgi:hypothetical protein